MYQEKKSRLKENQLFTTNRLAFFIRLVVFFVSFLFVVYIFYTFFNIQKEPLSIKIFGTSIINEQELLEYLQIEQLTTYEIDTYELSLNLRKHHWIEQGFAKIIPPSQLEIHIQERKPIAFFKAQTKVFFIDKERILLPIRDVEGIIDLPIIQDNSLQLENKVVQLGYFEIQQIVNFISLVHTKKISLLKNNIAEIDISNPLYFKLITRKNNINIIFSYNTFPEALIKLHNVTPNLTELAKPIRRIDARYNDKIIIQQR